MVLRLVMLQEVAVGGMLHRVVMVVRTVQRIFVGHRGARCVHVDAERLVIERTLAERFAVLVGDLCAFATN